MQQLRFYVSFSNIIIIVIIMKRRVKLVMGYCYYHSTCSTWKHLKSPVTSVSHDPHDMCKTAAALVPTAGVAGFVVVIVDKSKFSVKSAVCKVKGSTEVFLS